MEVSSLLSLSCSSSALPNLIIPTPSYSSPFTLSHSLLFRKSHLAGLISRPFTVRTSLRTSTFTTVDEAPEKPISSDSRDMLPKIDKSGRFCSPRAARELALSIVYASCLEGSDPVRLFEKRMNIRREPGYEFDKASLLEYNPMSFGGPPVTVQTAEEADELLLKDENESAIEAEVLAAPPKLVYSKLILRFARKLLVAVMDKWDSHVLVIDIVAPPNWKDEPGSRILELCILHLAMSEITVLGTRHQIVINERVPIPDILSVLALKFFKMGRTEMCQTDLAHRCDLHRKCVSEPLQTLKRKREAPLQTRRRKRQEEVIRKIEEGNSSSSVCSVNSEQVAIRMEHEHMLALLKICATERNLKSRRMSWEKIGLNLNNQFRTDYPIGVVRSEYYRQYSLCRDYYIL